MKTKTVIFGLLISSFAVAATPPTFIEVKADKSAYIVNEKAIFTTYVKTQPENPNDEIYIDAKLDNATIKLTRISIDQAATVTPALVLGNHQYEVSAYLQDKRTAEALNGAVAFYQDEITSFELELSTETDPIRRAQILDLIIRNQELIAIANSDLAANKRLIEIKTVDINVNPALHLGMFTMNDDVLLIEPDHIGANYIVGEAAVFSTFVLSDFNDIDGAQEIVLRAKLDSTDLGVTETALRQYSSTSSIFLSGDLGEHEFQVKLFTRSKARSDSLRNGIVKANESRAALIILRDETSDPLKKAYYQGEIDDLTLITNVFYNQLETMLTLIQSKSFFITVTN